MARKKVYGCAVRSSVWESDTPIVHDCGKLGKDFNIHVKPLVKEKIEALMEEYPSIEWLAYLIGEIDWDNSQAEVTDLAIPKDQTVTTASVDEIERDDVETIGVIHSHHRMVSGFSATDWEYINQNNTISIVIYDSGKKLEACVKKHTECGAIAFIKSPKVKFVTECDFDKQAFINEAKSKIKEYSYNSQGYGYGFGNNAFFPEDFYHGGRLFRGGGQSHKVNDKRSTFQDKRAEHDDGSWALEEDDPVKYGAVEVYDPVKGESEYYYPN